MTDLTVFREYEPHECGDDGYPFVWHKGAPCPNDSNGDGDCGRRGCPWCAGDGSLGVKDWVRHEADNRCIRCGHPYVKGKSAILVEERDETVRRIPNQLLLAFMDVDREDEEMPEIMVTRTSYSPCDAHCTHGGPARARVSPDRPWEVKPDATPNEIARAVAQRIEVQAAYRILTVHHINGRKHDLRWWNLASLCQRCHLSIQRKVILERVWPGEHTAWFQEYAAGWYAYVYLGENLSRAEVRSRLDALLSLERNM